MATEQLLGDDKPEDRVTEELEALVGLGPGRFRAPGAVGDRPFEQLRLGERPPQPLRQGVELGAEGQGYEASSLATT